MASRWTWVFLVVHFASLFLTAIGETCSYSDQVGKKGPQNLWTGFKGTADLDGCKTFCGTQSVCIAGEFNAGSFSCYLYSSEPTLTADTQTTFFLRTCVADTTTTSAPTTYPTTTPTTTPNTNPKSCLMTKSSRTTDGAVDYKVSLGNADSCNRICLHTKTCRATTYTPGNCTLHSQALTAASGDIVDFVRQTCNDGTFCCMSSATTQKTNGTPLLSISTTASLEGCEAICLAVADCKGTYYSHESCFFYTTTPTTTSDGQILFSKKTCPGDQTNHGQLAYDTTCEERPKKTYRQTHMYTSFHHNYNVYDMWGPQQLRIYWYYPWPYYSVPDYAYFLDTVLMLAFLAD